MPTPRDGDAPPLLHLSSDMAFSGTDSNICLRATKRVEKGHFIIAVAASSCMHARNPAVPVARRARVEQAAAALRHTASWKTPLVDASDGGRLECILLLALELLEGERSSWCPYLRSLPAAEDAVPPSLWAALLGASQDAELLRDTSIGALGASDRRDPDPDPDPDPGPDPGRDPHPLQVRSSPRTGRTSPQSSAPITTSRRLSPRRAIHAARAPTPTPPTPTPSAVSRSRSCSASRRP